MASRQTIPKGKTPPQEALPADTHPPPHQPNRWIWADRYSTSLLIAEAFAADAGGSLEWVILVSGRSWHEAVVASAVAGSLGAPVLMTPPHEVRDDVLGFLERVGTSQALLISTDSGDRRTIDLAVDEQLQDAGLTVERVGGRDQYDTAVAVAERLGDVDELGTAGKTAIVASGEVFADALVAGPLSAQARIPVLLSPRAQLHSGVAEYPESAGIERVVLMGGAAALSGDVERRIDEDVAIVRIAGGTRFETAALMARYAAEQAGAGCFAGGRAGLARARVPFDSFSAAPLLARQCAALVLTEPAAVPESTAGYLDDTRRAAGDTAATLFVFGGEAAVSTAAINDYLGGEDDQDEAEPAAKSDKNTFVSVSAGPDVACGVKSDNSVVCWGPNDYRRKYDGLSRYSFTQVSVNGSYACGIRSDASIFCLGRGVGTDVKDRYHGPNGGNLRHPGPFSAVSAGPNYHCVIQMDQRVRCFNGALAPSGKYSAISTSARFACGIRVDETLNCWHAMSPSGWGKRHRTHVLDSGVLDAPSGRYIAVSVTASDPYLAQVISNRPDPSNFGACAIGVDQVIVCWGENSAIQADVPVGKFGDISVGFNHACARRVSQTIVCWGDNSDGQADAPVGRFLDISVSGSDSLHQSCGVRLEGTIECWGLASAPSVSIVTNAPLGQFSTITSSAGSACALRRDGTLACWGSSFAYAYERELYRLTTKIAPVGKFLDISIDGRIVCAAFSDQPAGCQELWRNEATEIPGTFAAIEVKAGELVCAIALDQTLSCRGKEGYRVSEKFGDFATNEAGKVAVYTSVDLFHDIYACWIRTDGRLTCATAFICSSCNASGFGRSTKFSGFNLGFAYGEGSDSSLGYSGLSYSETKYISVDLNSSRHSNGTQAVLCAVRDDHVLACYAERGRTVQEPIRGFVEVAVINEDLICAIRTDQTVACWNPYTEVRKMQTDEKFTAIFASRDNDLNTDEFLCGIKTGGGIVCWSWVTMLPDGVSHIL